MAFKNSNEYIEQYQAQGYVVFRGMIPATLIGDLRRVCEDGKRLAREKNGANAQRLQPVASYEIDQKPFEDFRDLPELTEAFRKVLGEHHVYGDPDTLGVLIEPAQNSWCTTWHRDWRDTLGVDIRMWEPVQSDPDLFNQINAPLYEDSCTWVVPGSHNRPDTRAEKELFPDRPLHEPDFSDLREGTIDDTIRERRCIEYCRSMPNAKQLFLAAGDVALYRNSIWHIGSYVPYKKRATLHDNTMTPRFKAWHEDVMTVATRRRQAGVLYDNPHRPVVHMKDGSTLAREAAPT